jgi:uncharacterized protein YneF (UPF0154 family)
MTIIFIFLFIQLSIYFFIIFLSHIFLSLKTIEEQLEEPYLAVEELLNLLVTSPLKVKLFALAVEIQQPLHLC